MTKNKWYHHISLSNYTKTMQIHENINTVLWSYNCYLACNVWPEFIVAINIRIKEPMVASTCYQKKLSKGQLGNSLE